MAVLKNRLLKMQSLAKDSFLCYWHGIMCYYQGILVIKQHFSSQKCFEKYFEKYFEWFLAKDWSLAGIIMPLTQAKGL